MLVDYLSDMSGMKSVVVFFGKDPDAVTQIYACMQPRLTVRVANALLIKHDSTSP